MYFTNTLLAVVPLFMLAQADRIEFDVGDAPRQCRELCRPIHDLARQCHVDIDGNDDDRQEDLLESQCFCTNESFDVGSLTALCQDCIRQNRNSNDSDDNDDDDNDDDRDDWDDEVTRRVKRDNFDDAFEDVSKIVRTCGFSNETYSSITMSSLTSVTVSASRVTNTADLTTTFNIAAGAAVTGGSAGGSGSGSDDNDDRSSTNSGNLLPTQSSSSGGSGSSDDSGDSSNASSNDDGEDAAGVLTPSVWLAIAAVAGGFAFLG